MMSEYSRVLQIYQKLTPKPQDMISSDRFFVREGYLHYWDNKKDKLKKRYFFLFNDILLATKKEINKKYWLRIHITLRSPNVSVEDMETNPFQFKLHCKLRTFTFQTDSPELKEAWLEDILGSVSGYHDEKQQKISKDRDQLLRNPKLNTLEKKNEDDSPLDFDNEDSNSEPKVEKKKKKKEVVVEEEEEEEKNDTKNQEPNNNQNKSTPKKKEKTNEI